MHLLWAVLEFEGLSKHLKCKRAGSCRGVKERGEERSEGLRGRRAAGHSWRAQSGAGEEEERGERVCVQQVAENTNVARQKICNPDC